MESTDTLNPGLVAINTSWNELVYLKNQLPLLLPVFDKIVICDDFSTDGTKEWIESLNDPKIDFFQRKFDDCAHQFDAMLQRCPKDNTWVFCTTPDELPTNFFLENVRLIINHCKPKNIDRLWTTVFHLRSEREIASEIGGEIRLYLNDAHHECKYIDYPHERLDGRFDGYATPQVDERFAFVHFKQADPVKLQLWKGDYVEKGVYSLWDVNRRLNMSTIPLPENIEYSVNKELREYLGWDI